jgi:hypothetical protein
MCGQDSSGSWYGPTDFRGHDNQLPECIKGDKFPD